MHGKARKTSLRLRGGGTVRVELGVYSSVILLGSKGSKSKGVVAISISISSITCSGESSQFCDLSVVSSISVISAIYSAASRKVSVLEGFLSSGNRGMSFLSLSMFSLSTCTRLRSLAFASLLCLLIPVRQGPRRRVFFLLLENPSAAV